jgi:prevent-host-death family protein
MKKISELQSLVGQVETISLTDLRNLPGEVFNQVQMGKQYVVTKSGKIIARIMPQPKPVAFLEPSSDDRPARSRKEKVT